MAQSESALTVEKLKRDEALFRCFAQIIQHPAAGLQEFLEFALEKALELTASHYGLLYRYRPQDRMMVRCAHSRNALKDCHLPKCPRDKPLDAVGVWGDAIRRRAPVVVNDYQAPYPGKRGYPPGHIPLKNFLSVPVSREGEIAAIVGVANKARHYDERDVEQLQLLMEMVWKVVDRIEAQEALRRKTEELEDYFNHSLDLLCIAGPDGRLVRLNPEWERVLGHSPQEMEGRSLFDFVHPDDLHRTAEALAHLSSQQPLLNFENRYRCKDGSYRWIEWRSAPREGLIYAAARDITQRKEMERELRELNRQLEEAIVRANALAAEAAAASAAKSDFLAQMSHEIRNPLNGILGMLQLLEASRLTLEQREFTQTAVSCAQSLLTLVQDILDLSRVEAGKLNLERLAFSLPQLLLEFHRSVEPLARAKGLHLSVQMQEGVPQSLVGDPHRLRQVLANLVTNAIKYTDSGGVHISVAASPTSPQEVVLRFSVRDTGPGIPSDQIPRLFTKFTRLDPPAGRSGEGAGLGLAISQALCRLMGGEIGVNSAPGLGSEFWFTVRMGVADPGPADESSSSHDSQPSPGAAPLQSDVLASGRKLRILVADDNPTNQLVAIGLLKRLGYSARAVANGEEAVRALESEDFDLVLMDVQMPVMDGFQATRVIRDPSSAVRRHDTPVIAMTAHAMAGDRDRCLAAGMNDYLSKPVRIQELAERLRRWLPSGSEANSR